MSSPNPSTSVKSDRKPRRQPPPSVRWFRTWVPQAVVATGGKCSLLKWVNEGMLRSIEEKNQEAEKKEPEPEPTTEVLFLCSHEGCGKTFIDVGALKKHAHVHGERQYVCQYEGCGKKFGDSSKLKRHRLIHTGERHHICPHPGCGKAFSLDFNLRTHMRTHSAENYHVCPFKECGKRFTQEEKLNSHIRSHHEKNPAMDTTKRPPPAEKPHSTPKPPSVVYTAASPDRPYTCPYEGCSKAYIHEYKLNLHLRKEHPGHNIEENKKQVLSNTHAIEDASGPDTYTTKGGSNKKSKKRKPSPTVRMPAAKIGNWKSSPLDPPTANSVKQQQAWLQKAVYEDDSEETEDEEHENVDEGGWKYQENDEDDEETEDEE